MYLSLCLFVILNTILSNCVTVERYDGVLSSKTKVELTPHVIKCLLGDIVIISAPELNKKSLYYLHSPNNVVTKLNIPRNNSKRQHSQHITLNYSNNITSFLNLNKYRVYSTTTPNSNIDVLGEKEKSMRENEFMIGPLLEGDHGNWVLSVFFKDLDDEYVELFQVISIEIFDYVRIIPFDALVKKGATLHISFEYPIPFLETCELTAPNTTFDRFFDRNQIELDRCGYVLPNITTKDGGFWSIKGVGRIIYMGQILLTVYE